MENAPVNWTPGLVALAIGLVIGIVLVLRSRGRKAAAAAAPPSRTALERRDLESKRDGLIGQLRELEDTAAKRSPEQLARERQELELEAARVLLALDTLLGRSAPRIAAPVEGAPGTAGLQPEDEGESEAEAPEGNPALRGFLWAAGSMAAIGLVIFLVTGSAQVREQGGSVTGNTPAMGGQRPQGRPAAPSAPSTPEEAQLLATVQKNPDDLDSRLALARIYLGKQDMMGVWNETQYVLSKRPDDAYALSYQSLVRLAMGQPQVALEMLDRSLAKEPEVLQTYVHKALVQLRIGDVKGADATFKTASTRFPEQAQMLGQLQERMKGEVEPIAAPEGDPHASLGGPAAAAPGAAAPAPAAAPAAAGDAVSVALELDPTAISAIQPGSVVFVIVRPSGVQGGPPAAVKRLPPGPFPMRFTIGAGDSMTGDPLPASMRVEARVDADGNAASRDPGDPVAHADGVKAGADVKLVLRRP